MNELLKALADHDRHLEAPDAVELRLRAAFRKKHSRRAWPYFALAMAAAIALVLFLIPRPKEQTMQIALAVPPVVNVPTPRMPTPVIAQTHPAKETQPREIATEFYPLVDDMPFDRGEIFRVELPAIAMRRVGLPVSEDHLGDRVQADVLVGEEGLARAVRFVRLER
jgi:hypothetical protein